MVRNDTIGEKQRIRNEKQSVRRQREERFQHGNKSQYLGGTSCPMAVVNKAARSPTRKYYVPPKHTAPDYRWGDKAVQKRNRKKLPNREISRSAHTENTNNV